MTEDREIDFTRECEQDGCANRVPMSGDSYCLRHLLPKKARWLTPDELDAVREDLVHLTVLTDEERRRSRTAGLLRLIRFDAEWDARRTRSALASGATAEEIEQAKAEGVEASQKKQ